MDNNPSFQFKIFQLANKNRKNIVNLFKLTYFLVLAFIIAGAYVTFTNHTSQPYFYELAIGSGKLALALLMIAVIPGILGRFGVKIQITFIITNFRRYIGILMFLTALAHASIIRLFPYLSGLIPFTFPPPTFEIFGFLALFLLFWMFITANEGSVISLGVWWKRLHRLVYLVLWLIAFHVVLQRMSIWSILILIVAILEVLSLVYAFFKRGRIS